MIDWVGVAVSGMPLNLAGQKRQGAGLADGGQRPLIPQNHDVVSLNVMASARCPAEEGSNNGLPSGHV